MFDLEAAADRMRAANSGGVKRYCFYLRDTLPHSGGYFFWYDGKGALNDGLINDLVGFVYSDPKEEEFSSALSLICSFKLRSAQRCVRSSASS